MSETSRSPWVPLPIGPVPVYLLGPTPAEAMVAVDPFLTLDEPRTAMQTVLAGWCAEGKLLEPLEIEIVVEPNRIVPKRQVPLEAALDARAEAAAVMVDLPAPRGFGWLRGLQVGAQAIGPLVFCRKVRKLFVARGRETRKPLVPLPVEHACGGAVFPGLVSCELDDETPLRCYAGATGDIDGQPVASLEQLLVDQAHVVVAAQQSGEPAAAEWCCQCKDCHEIDADDAEYKAALDRLVVVHAAPTPLVMRPHGEWSLADGMSIVGGRPIDELLPSAPANAYETWRREHAQRYQNSGPSHVMTGETDGRNLSEILRIKLQLIADALTQLGQVWDATGRPHLCWDADTLRVAWRSGSGLPANAWGMQALLGRIGFQPVAGLDTVNGEPLPYPPAFSDSGLLAGSVNETARHWDEARTGTLFVKTANDADGGQEVTVLVEDLGLAWEPFELSDTLHVSGDGWQAVLSPLPERDPNDGEGLPFGGTVAGDKVKVGEDYAGVEIRWYPRFGEAVDLHAVAMMAVDGLLGTDERSGENYHSAVQEQVDELTGSLQSLPIEQREAFAQNFVAERAEQDAPAAVWSRRNLLYGRDDRGQTQLEGMPSMLWQATVLWLLRCMTNVDGFGYCPDRTASAPRSGELLLPLLELQGLLALLDDAIWQRKQPADAVREALTAEDDE